MSLDLRLSQPVKTNESIGTGERDGILFASLIRDCQARVLSGTEKLVQQIYLEIVNDPLPDGTGSGLASDLIAGPPEPASLQSIAIAGVDRVRANIMSYQRSEIGNLTEDELLADLRVISFDVSGTNFELRLEVTTVSGEVTLTPAVISL